MSTFLLILKYVLYAVGFLLLAPITFAFFTVMLAIMLAFGLLGVLATIPLLIAESIDDNKWFTTTFKEIVKKEVQEEPTILKENK